MARLITLALATLFFSACGGGGVSENRSNRGLTPGVGPFDKHGNYVESWADDQSKGVAWRADRVVGEIDEPKQLAQTTQTPKIKEIAPVVASHVPRVRPPVVGSSTPRSKPQVTSRPSVASKPKASKSPKPKVVRVKPKHKSPVRHTIKKGDTLYGLSRKYKTSVSSIQRANGLKGTNLRIGRVLLIPRY